ncbi:MAG: flagellar hook capping FlgD N-terminal domain-containing protein [Syntrophomonadaceae bacterium]
MYVDPMTGMVYSGTSAASSTTSSSSSSTSSSSTGELDKDAFLKLLCTQLQNQDPLNPTDSTEQIAQMASFSSLEQMQNLNESFKSLTTTITDSIVPNMLLQQAGSMIGRTVVYENPDATGDDDKYLSGVISSVNISDGAATYYIDGQEIEQSSIVGMGTSAQDREATLLSQILAQLRSNSETDTGTNNDAAETVTGA